MTESNKKLDWQNRLRTLGFREAGISFLRDRLTRESKKKRVDVLVHRLSKYEPHQEIVSLLRLNPAWRQRIEELAGELPEIDAQPEVYFVFQSGGNVPNIPTLGEDRLYLGSGEYFYALDGESGAIIWHLHSPGKRWTTAWLCGDHLYVSLAGALYALSAADGSTRWCFEAGKQLTSPYSCEGRVFVGSEEGTLYAVDARAGTRLWTFNVAQSIFVAPAVWENKIFAASKDHKLYAVRLTDGECRWHFTTGGKIYAYPYVSEGTVYLAGADHRVYALHAGSGQLLWSFSTGGEIHTSPFEKDGVVYLSSRDRHLYALRAEDGKELWRHRMLGYASSPTVRCRMIYFSAQGRVYGFSAADHKMRWCFPLGASVATCPVVGNKRIYSGTLGGTLLCLALKINLDEQGATQVLRQFLERESEAEPE
ncbi:MAG: PQQ-binding-like beta-propeller repeat protein [Syntrophobacteria bacterium]